MKKESSQQYEIFLPQKHTDLIDLTATAKDKYRCKNRKIQIAIYAIIIAAILLSVIWLTVIFFIGRTSSPGIDTGKRSPPFKTVRGTADHRTLKLFDRPQTTVSDVSSKRLTDPATDQDKILDSSRADLIKSEFIRRMAYEAWDRYERYAWGHDALRPNTKQYASHQFGINSGLTIVTALSTLRLMKMDEEYRRGAEWIRDSLNFGAVGEYVNVHAAIGEYIGSLLSCYALTGDKMFAAKAIEVANILVPAYHNVTGLPYARFKPNTGSTADTVPNLSAVGGQRLEYSYLSAISSDPQYRARDDQIRGRLRKIDKPNGLYLKNVYIEQGGWTADISTFASASGAFYSTLIKSYIQSNGSDHVAIEMYRDAIESAVRMELFVRSHSGHLYARHYHVERQTYGNYMNYDACYLGAMLALGADAMRRSIGDERDGAKIKAISRQAERDMLMAEELVDTCHLAANRSRSKLPPHHFYFTHQQDVTNHNQFDYQEFHLSPELVESYFVLYRLTRKAKYREYAWQFAEAIHENCRTANGFTRVANVAHPAGHVTQSNYQDAAFLGSTLKYLYLIFADQSILPLDQWVFNAYGQPLPICGKSTSRPECQPI